ANKWRKTLGKWRNTPRQVRHLRHEWCTTPKIWCHLLREWHHSRAISRKTPREVVTSCRIMEEISSRGSASLVKTYDKQQKTGRAELAFSTLLRRGHDISRR
ncbi:MAG: hypothetical protein K8R88_02675, partial [Armatimonadetes bacterium]|nr:hypothetical protein [Armatimonadota bacterium]